MPTTYTRRNGDGDVVERITPEPGSLEEQRLVTSSADESSPWSAETREPGAGDHPRDSVEGSTAPLGEDTDQAAKSAPSGRAPRGPRSGSSSSSSDSGGEG